MATMNVWQLHYIPPIQSDEYVEMSDLVLIASWYGNEKPTKASIQDAMKQSSYNGGKFLLKTTTEMG